MPGRATTAYIHNFAGLDKTYVPGKDIRWTSSLDGVKIRYGKVYGSLGISKFQSISTPMSTTPIIGLMSLVDANLATTPVRMSPSKLEKFAGGSWQDLGVTLTGTSTTRPQFTSIQQNLVTVNEGHDRPQIWTGSGNAAQLAAGAVSPCIPPYAKSVSQFLGFLFLGNVSDDGSFGDIIDGYRTIAFSAAYNDPTAGWCACDGNFFVLDQTPGEINSMVPIGRIMTVGKSDGMVGVRFSGGATRFTAERIPNAVGVIAPLSLQGLQDYGAIWLGTDYQLWYTDGQTAQRLPQNVNDILQNTLSAANAPFCVGTIFPDEDTYHLFYNRTGGTGLDGRISYNFRDQTFYHRSYAGQTFQAVHTFRTSQTTANITIASGASTSGLVYNIDSGKDDDGTAVSRYYDIDWHHFGIPGSKEFTGANLAFKTAPSVQVRVSVACDYSHIFQYPKMFSLKGKFPSDDLCRVNYELPSPIYGTWFRVRVEFFQYSTNQVELREFEPRVIAVHPTTEDVPKQPQPTRA